MVIGLADHHCPPKADRAIVSRTFRQYGASLSRVEVITYDQLLEAAERALAFEADTNKDQSP